MRFPLSPHPTRAHPYYGANLNISDYRRTRISGARDAVSSCLFIRTVCLQLFPSLSHTYVLQMGDGPGVHSTQMTFPKTGSLPQEAPGRSFLLSCGTTP